MDVAHADGLWARDLLATAGPFVPLAALLLGPAYLVFKFRGCFAALAGL